MEGKSFQEKPQNSIQVDQNAQNEDQIVKYEQLQPKVYKMRGPPRGSKRRPNLAAGIKAGTWTINEMNSYLKFIVRFQNHFQDKIIRKKKKIFHRMSNFVKSRTAQQCRSHHQKLELKFITHQKVIEHIKEEISRLNKQLESHQMKEKLAEQLQMEKKVIQKTNLQGDPEFYDLRQRRGILFVDLEFDKISEFWE